MKHIKYLAATAAAAIITGSGAMAATVSIDQIGAVWFDPTGTPEPAFTNNLNVDNGDGDPMVGGETVTVEWGVPTASATGQSGYSFAPNPLVPYIALDGTPQNLGTFTHFNQPISASGGSLETVSLGLHFAGTPITPSAGPQTSFGAIFNFTHDETTNTNDVDDCNAPPQQSGTPCDDVVTVSAVGGASETIIVGSTEYTFTLLGFSPDGTAGSFSNMFITEEGQANSRDLWFNYTVSPVNVIPLPAAGWLLLAGLGAMGLVGRRRKSA